MKLAIQIAGQPRVVQVGYDTLKKFYLDKYDCDIFIHTWFDDKFPLSVYGDIVNLYKPKKILVEKQLVFDTTNRQDPMWTTTSLNTIMSQYYSVYMANQLRNWQEQATGIKYDFVMRMRTDLQLLRPIELEKIESGKLAVHEWTQLPFDWMGLSDVFAIGSPEVMNAYTSLYPKILYYLDGDKDWSIPHSKMRPEYILKRHVDASNLQVQKFYHKDLMERTWEVIR